MSGSRGSSVDAVRDYELDGRDLIPGKGRILFVSTASRPTVGPTQVPIQRVPGALSPRINWHGREADHSPQFSVEVKNGGAMTPLYFLCEQGTERHM
jgi:hypothetical protein